MPPARGAVAFSSEVLLLSNPWLRTLNKVSDQVPTFRNAPTAPIPVTLPFALTIISPLISLYQAFVAKTISTGKPNIDISVTLEIIKPLSPIDCSTYIGRQSTYLLKFF